MKVFALIEVLFSISASANIKPLFLKPEWFLVTFIRTFRGFRSSAGGFIPFVSPTCWKFFFLHWVHNEFQQLGGYSDCLHCLRTVLFSILTVSSFESVHVLRGVVVLLCHQWWVKVAENSPNLLLWYNLVVTLCQSFSLIRHCRVCLGQCRSVNQLRNCFQ